MLGSARAVVGRSAWSPVMAADREADAPERIYYFDDAMAAGEADASGPCLEAPKPDPDFKAPHLVAGQGGRSVRGASMESE